MGRPELATFAAAEGRASPRLGDALFTRLLGEDMVLQGADGRVWASLGNAVWAALVYPLCERHRYPSGLRSFNWGGGNSALEFVHVVDPSSWLVLTCRSALAPAQGIHLEETEPPLPLLEASLRDRSRMLTMDLLQQVADYLHIGGVRNERSALLRAVANHVFAARVDKDEFVEAIVQRDPISAKRGVPNLLEDPLFEAAWDDMPPDEQFEFPDVRKEKTRGRVRRHLALRKERGAPALRRRGPRRRGREDVEQPAGARAPEHPPAGAPGQPPADTPGQSPPDGPGQPPADAAGQALAPAQDILPLPKRRCREREGPGVPRALPWGREVDGRQRFVLARTHERGELAAITVTCNVHRADGRRCNKHLSLGVHFSEEEATRRIMEWCIRGLEIPDEPGGEICTWILFGATHAYCQ